ncbi:MAG: hypothetical protein COA58_00210 [Bacteroidetes bacterium]|nr:MAG: hypothetical protein COA58_00210 [Bacteroidota bacterium]
MKVKNLNNTSGRKAPKGYASWLDYWQQQMKSYGNTKCRNNSCTSYAEVGGHVFSPDGRTSDHWYIVAICKSCNAVAVSYDVDVNSLIRIT